MQDGLQMRAGAKAAGRWISNRFGRGSATEDTFTIQIQFSTVADSWKLVVSPEETIADVKQQIFDKHKIPSTQQILFMSGSAIAMLDTQMISHYKLKENAILHLSLTYIRRPWKIYVEYATGDPVPVTVFPDKALDMVRIMIFDQDVTLVDNDDQEYDYAKTLTEQNIKNGETIYAQKSNASVDIPVQEEAVQRHDKPIHRPADRVHEGGGEVVPEIQPAEPDGNGQPEDQVGGEGEGVPEIQLEKHEGGRGRELEVARGRGKVRDSDASSGDSDDDTSVEGGRDPPIESGGHAVDDDENGKLVDLHHRILNHVQLRPMDLSGNSRHIHVNDTAHSSESGSEESESDPERQRAGQDTHPNSRTRRQVMPPRLVDRSRGGHTSASDGESGNRAASVTSTSRSVRSNADQRHRAETHNRTIGQLNERIRLILEKLHISDDLDVDAIFARVDEIHEKVVEIDAFTSALTKVLFEGVQFKNENEMLSDIYSEVAHMKTCVDAIFGELNLPLTSTFKKCREEVVRINKSNDKLLDDAQHHEAALQARDVTIAELKETNKELTKIEGMDEDGSKLELQQAAIDLAAEKEKNRTQAAEIDRMKQKITQIELAEVLHKKQLDAAVADFGVRSQSLIAQLKESEAAIQEMEAVKATDDDTIAAKDAKIAKKKEVIEVVKGTCADLKTQNATASGHVTRLEQELAAATKRVGEYEANIPVKELEISQLQDQLQRHTGAKKDESVRIRDLEASIHGKDAQITKITGEGAALHRQLGRRDASIIKLTGELDALKITLGARDTKIKEINGELDKLQHRVGRQDEQIKRDQKHHITIVALKDKFELDLKAREKELQRVQRALDAANSHTHTAGSMHTRAHTPEVVEGIQATGRRHTVYRSSEGGTRSITGDEEVRHDGRSGHHSHTRDDDRPRVHRSEQHSHTRGEGREFRQDYRSSHSVQLSQPLNFVHLLARLHALVGPREKERNVIVNALVDVFEHYITNPRIQNSIITTIMPHRTVSSEPMDFGRLLYDYLLQHDTATSLQSRLAQLRLEAGD
jgi:hypothetical protein